MIFRLLAAVSSAMLMVHVRHGRHGGSLLAMFSSWQGRHFGHAGARQHQSDGKKQHRNLANS